MKKVSLRVKLLLAFVLVALSGILALIATAELSAGGFYDAHIVEMTQRFGAGAVDPMHQELRNGFAKTLAQSLWVGLLVGIPLSLIMGFWVAQRVIHPLTQLSTAARRIAAGAYSERLSHHNSQNLDELGLLLQDFNRMAQALETVEARRTELIGTVAHELRTPLSGLQGYAEGLSDGLFEPQQAAQAIHREVSRLKRLVNDLSEVSRVESGAVQLRLERFDLVSLVHEVLERYQPIFLEGNTPIKVQIPSASVMASVIVEADRDRVTQILINLLSNALKHAPESRIEVILKVPNPQEAHLEIRDFGPGIAPEHLPHLFERFYRADPSRSSATGGSGVGLTISSHLARAMGGRIEVKSVLGTGSSFTLILPLA